MAKKKRKRNKTKCHCGKKKLASKRFCQDCINEQIEKTEQQDKEQYDGLKIKIGERVKAQWKNGKWYKGKVTGFSEVGSNTGTIAHVLFDDGDSAPIPFSQIKRIKSEKRKVNREDRYIAKCPKCKHIFGRSNPAYGDITYYCGCTQGSHPDLQLIYKLNPDGPGELPQGKKAKPKSLYEGLESTREQRLGKPEKTKKKHKPHKLDNLPDDVDKIIKLLKQKPPKHEARQLRAQLRNLGHVGGLKGSKA